MNEVIYPLSAVLLLYFVVIPILTLAAHALLLRRARSFSEVQDWGAAWVWTAIVAPVLLPVSWWIVDVMHQIGDHHTLEACLTPHADGGCAESFILGILVVTPVVLRLFRTQFSAPRGARWVPNDPRVQSLRVYMVTDLCDPIATRGLLNPWIGLREDALALLGHEELVVALLHEAEHVRGRDPLRRWLAGLAFSLNPAGYLLEPYFSRWELGREAICDLEAAARGDRFALAQALVRVARLNLVPASHAAGLVGHASTLTLRVSILIHDRLPALVRRRYWQAFAFLGLSAVGAQWIVHRGMHDLHQWSEALFILFLN